MSAHSPVRPTSPVHPRLRALSLGLIAALSLACGEGDIVTGGVRVNLPAGGSPTGGGLLGGFAIVLTDAPLEADRFEQILVTLTKIVLIGDSGEFPVFDDPRGKTVDLRELEDVGELVTVARKVPIATFEKIRLIVKEMELVPADGGPSIFPKLPPKLDIQPRRKIALKPGRNLFVEIDFDAGNSVHLVEANGKVIVRPVILADVLGGAATRKQVLLQGVVRELDLVEDDFLLCRSHSVSRPRDGERVTEHGDDFDWDEADDRKDFCARVFVDEDTSVFDEAGDSADLDVLAEGESASVLGRFASTAYDVLAFRANVIQDGPPGTARAIDGVVLTAAADYRFEMSVDDAQGFPPGTGLVVELQEGARIFSRRGRELDVDDIQPGTPVRAVGVLPPDADDFLKASVVVLDLHAMQVKKTFGRIGSIDDDFRLEVDTLRGTRCVDVPASADVFAVDADYEGGSFSRIDRSELAVGDLVASFGATDASDGCLDAHKVIAFRDDP